MDNSVTLYHGSPNRMIHPQYGLGQDRHDYGRGFYLTPSKDLAKEWAVCLPGSADGWLHVYELSLTGLELLDFTDVGALAWLAELMKHRPASDSRRYRMLSERFIQKYGVETSNYDVIRGWRANASYFYIAKSFVRDEIDISILEDLLMLGDLGIQYCVKSEAAYKALKEVNDMLEAVPHETFNAHYNERDERARRNMRELVNSERNPVTNVFSTLV